MIKKISIVVFIALESLPSICFAGYSYSELNETLAEIYRYDTTLANTLVGMAIVGCLGLFYSMKNFFIVTAQSKKNFCVLLALFCLFSLVRSVQGFQSVDKQLMEYEASRLKPSSNTDVQEETISLFMRAYISNDIPSCMKFVTPSTRGNTQALLRTLSDSILTVVQNGTTGNKISYELAGLRFDGESAMFFSYVLYVNNNSAGIFRDIRLLKTNDGLWKIDTDSFAVAQAAMSSF